MAEVVRLAEVADYLRVRLLRKNELPAFKVGSDCRFNRTSIDRWRTAVELIDKANAGIAEFLKFKSHDSDIIWQSVRELQELTRQLKHLRPAFDQNLRASSPANPALTLPELRAVLRARQTGWLEITPDMGDRALAYWQECCQLMGRAHALARPEGHRTSIWLFLPEGWRWKQAQREQLAKGLMPGAKGFLFSEDNVRAFVTPGNEAEIFTRLLEAARPKQLLHPWSNDDGHAGLHSNAATHAEEL